MDYKKEIIKILEDEAVLLDEGYGTTGITEDEHEKIAERIVKLFAIPHVIKSVCGNCSITCMFRSIDNNCENEDGCDFKKQTVL